MCVKTHKRKILLFSVILRNEKCSSEVIMSEYCIIANLLITRKMLFLDFIIAKILPSFDPLNLSNKTNQDMVPPYSSLSVSR